MVWQGIWPDDLRTPSFRLLSWTPAVLPRARKRVCPEKSHPHQECHKVLLPLNTLLLSELGLWCVKEHS